MECALYVAMSAVRLSGQGVERVRGSQTWKSCEEAIDGEIMEYEPHRQRVTPGQKALAKPRASESTPAADSQPSRISIRFNTERSRGFGGSGR